MKPSLKFCYLEGQVRHKTLPFQSSESELHSETTSPNRHSNLKTIKKPFTPNLAYIKRDWNSAVSIGGKKKTEKPDPIEENPWGRTSPRRNQETQTFFSNSKWIFWNWFCPKNHANFASRICFYIDRATTKDLHFKELMKKKIPKGFSTF